VESNGVNILSGGQSDFFGLDIGTTALRAVQLGGGGTTKTLGRYGEMAVDGRVAVSDAKEDQQKLAQYIKQLVDKVGITTKNVAVNLPSEKVFTTVVDMDKMTTDDLAKAIRYQAGSYIPTPIDESKIDYVVIGNSPRDPKKMEVLLTSVANSYAESRLDILEGAGLNVVAFEPDSMALVRALTPADAVTPQMVLDVGNMATDLIIAAAGVPRLTRAIPIGIQSLIKSATQILGIDVVQAEQFIFKFGLAKDKLDNQIYGAVIGIIDSLMSEIEKSIKFFEDRYAGAKLDRIIVTGGASVTPELPLYIANKTGVSVEIGNSWRNVSFPAERQNELLAISNHFGVAVGLAEREA
jgi:type IV pilus assembly protein PilM